MLGATAQPPLVVLSDLDGTITTNTQAIFNEMMKDVLRDADVAIPDERTWHLMEGSAPEVYYHKLLEFLPMEEATKLKERHPTAQNFSQSVQGKLDEHLHEIEIRPGVRSLFEQAKERGIPVVVVTNAVSEHATKVLHAIGLMDLVQGVVTSDDPKLEGKHKPDPEHYWEGMRRAGLDPKNPDHVARSIALEDTPTGAQSAIAGGILTIQFKNPGGMFHRDAHVYKAHEISTNFQKQILSGDIFNAWVRGFNAFRRRVHMTYDAGAAYHPELHL